MKKLLSKLPPMTRHERGVLIATCLSSLGSFYTMAMTGFALPQIQKGLSIPEDEVGTLFALLRFGALFSVVIGVLADRLGRRRLLIAAVVGCAICNIATAFVQTGMQLAALQFLSRLFLGAQVLLAAVVVSEELSAENRGWGIGVLTAVGGMGGALTLLAYSFVDHLPYGWRSLFVLGGFGLLVVPWLWRSLSETRRFAEQSAAEGEQARLGSAWRVIGELARLHAGRLLAVVGVILPVAIILEPATVFITKHLHDELGYSPGQVGLMLALCGIATPLGNVLAGALTDRFGRRPGTIFVSLLLSGAAALFYGSRELVYVAPGLALLMASVGGLQVLHMALATELFPTAFRSTASGVREAINTFGASMGLVTLSALYDATGSHPTSIIWILALTPIAPIILLFVPETAGRELEDISTEGEDGR